MFSMADEDPVVVAAKLPLQERIAHSLWKVREAAYRELGDKFDSAAEDSRVYQDFASCLPKIVRDTIAAAQLVGLESTIKFCEAAHVNLVRRVAPEVSKGIIDKALSGRPANKQRAVDVILAFVGADAGEVALEPVTSIGFPHKTPKVATACIDAARLCLTTYGHRAVPAKTIASSVCPLFSHSNETVRKSAKLLLIELHRWVGDSVRGALKGAPDVIVKELEAAFAQSSKADAPQPLKLTRSMENRVRHASQADNDDEDDDIGAELAGDEAEIDLAEEVDLLAKLSKMKFEVDEGVTKDWYTAVECKKWNVRRDALNAAVEAIGDGRLPSTSYNEVIARLHKILRKDSNVNVVSHAVKLVGALAQGLRKNFSPASAKVLTADLLSCLKEKHRSVTDAVNSSLDMLHLKGCVQICELGEEISVAASSKVPKARCGLFKWLERCFITGINLAQLKGAPLKMFCNLAVAGSEDSSPDVRDAALTSLAALYVVAGQRSVKPYLEKLDKLRCDKIESLVKAMPPPKRVHATKDSSAATQKRSSNRDAKSKRAGPPESKADFERAKSPGHRQTPKQPRENLARNARTVCISDDEEECGVAIADALSAVKLICPTFDADPWTSKNSRARASATQVLCDYACAKESLDASEYDPLLSILSGSPGLDDSNFLAFKVKLELLGLVAAKAISPMPRATLKGLVKVCLEHLGDIKTAIVSTETLLTVVEATSPRYFVNVLFEWVQATANARAKIGVTKFAVTLLDEFGLADISLDTAYNLVTCLLSDPPAALRTVAVSLSAIIAARSEFQPLKLALVHRNVDDKIIDMIEAEMAKYKNGIDPPSRKKRFGSDSSMKGKLQAESDSLKHPANQAVREHADLPTSGRLPSNVENKAAASNPGSGRCDNVLPELTRNARANVADHFVAGSAIMTGLRDPNWKVRQSSLASINDIITSANSSISGNIGSDLMPALRDRLNDSNRNIAAAAYGTVGNLGRAMGRGALPHVKVIMPVVFGSGCIDIKKQVRDSAMSCVNLWCEAVSLGSFVPYLGAPLASLNSAFRKEYLEWLTPRLVGKVGSFHPASEDLSVLIDPCLSCLRDRTAEVRLLAEGFLEGVVASVGIAAVDAKVLNLSKSARLQLEAILSKYRNNDTTVSEGPSAQVYSSQRPNIRDRPRSMASPKVTLVQQQHLDEKDSNTPRSGLRRARPVSLRQPQIPGLIDTPPGVAESHRVNTPNNDASVHIETIKLLKPVRSRASRIERFEARKDALISDDGSAAGVSGVWLYVPETADDISNDLQECVTRDLEMKLMAPTNRFMLHIEGIQATMEAMQQDPDVLVACADVLLRWAAFRINDFRTPPTMLVKAAELVCNICEILLSSGIVVGDYEASAILFALVSKCGSNRIPVREGMLSAMLSVGDVMETGMLASYLVDCMWRTDTTQAKLQVASQLPSVFDRLFADGASYAPNLFDILAQVAYGSDDAAGKAAAYCIDRAHHYLGDRIWSEIGEVTDAQAELLETRFSEIVGSVDTADDEAALLSSDQVTEAHASTRRASASRRDPALASRPSHASNFRDDPIRAEDFRLSIAPQPPSHVMSVINDAESIGTPLNSRAGHNHRVSAFHTPSIPARIPQPRRDYSFISASHDSVLQNVLDLIACDCPEDQMQGLNILIDDFQHGRGGFTYDHAGDVLSRLSRSFRNSIGRFEKQIAGSGEVELLLKYAQVIAGLVMKRPFILTADQQVVEQLISEFVDSIVTEAMDSINVWGRCLQLVNMAVTNLLDICDRNLLFSALFHLLSLEIDTSRQVLEHHSSKFWLLTKSVNRVLKRGFHDISVNRLFGNLNGFLIRMNDSGSQTEDDDSRKESLRLVDAIVNGVAKEYGERGYKQLDAIYLRQSSPLLPYISEHMSGIRATHKSVALRNSTENAGSAPAASISESDDTGFRNVSTASENSEPDPSTELDGIFSKLVASGGNNAELRRLHAFMERHPSVTISAQMSRCSNVLRAYIQNGLRTIENETSAMNAGDSPVHSEHGGLSGVIDRDKRQGALANSASKPPRATRKAPGMGAEKESTGQAYLKRLKEIQLRYGLSERVPSSPTSQSMPSDDGYATPLSAQSTQQSPNSGNEENVESRFSSLSVAETRDKATALRERMAKIRESSTD